MVLGGVLSGKPSRVGGIENHGSDGIKKFMVKRSSDGRDATMLSDGVGGWYLMGVE